MSVVEARACHVTILSFFLYHFTKPSNNKQALSSFHFLNTLTINPSSIKQNTTKINKNKINITIILKANYNTNEITV